MKQINSSTNKFVFSFFRKRLGIVKNLSGHLKCTKICQILFFTFCGTLGIFFPGIAQNVNFPGLEAALDQNGNLISGIYGSFDTQGYEMQFGKNGEPVFTEQNSGINAGSNKKSEGIQWSALGGGVNFNVATVAVSGSDVYVGGQFTMAGGISANRIAKWDGNSWSALGTGVNGIVNAIAVSGKDVYVGGAFTSAGGISVGKIARWDGSAWSGLGLGLNFTVSAIAILGSEVYAGGIFTIAGGSPANYIAKWDGNNWFSLGNGMNGYVRALAVSGSDLYVGGQFTTPGNRIARWDGNNWYELGSGMNNNVNALAVSDNDIYAGGMFTTAGGSTAVCIAKWNGIEWSGLPGLTSFVNAIAVSGNDVYAGGNFTTNIGSPANFIAKWNGSIWSSIGSGTYNVVNALAINTEASKMLVGGTFTTVDAVINANYIASFSDSANSFPFAFNSEVPQPGVGTITKFGKTNLTFIGDITNPDLLTVYYYQVPPGPGSLPDGIILFNDFYWRVEDNGITFTNGFLRIATEDLVGVTVGGCGACLVWLKRSGSGESWQNIGGNFNGTFEEGSLTSSIPFDSFSEFTIGYTSNPSFSLPKKIDSNKFSLGQNYPNPFKSRTIINYEIGNIQKVSLKVFDIFGKEIKTLVNEEKPAGKYEVIFDSSNITSGIYIYKLQGSLFNLTKLMILAE